MSFTSKASWIPACRRRPSASQVLALLGLLAVTWLTSRPASAQVQRQRVVTMDTGVQFEGELFTIEILSEAAFVMSPYGAGNRIVVVDDGLRRVFLNENHVLAQIGESQRNEIEFEIPQRTFKGSTGYGALIRTGPFNEYGHRELVIQERVGNTTVIRNFVQGITKINPRFCKVTTLVGPEGTPRKWEMSIATGTVAKPVLRNMLLRRAEPGNVNDYFDIADFFRQTGDYQQASQELLLIENRFPDQAERIADLRTELGQMYGRQILREIRTRIDAGQSRLAVALAQAVDKQGLSLDLQAEYQDIETTATDQQRQLAESRQTVLDLLSSVNNLSPEQSAVTQRFRGELETELNLDNVGRLDAYLRLANDNSLPAPNKVALAISGWMLGSNNALENLATVETLYDTRDLVREYLGRDTEPQRREEILDRLATLETGSPTFIDALLKQTTPLDPMDLEAYTGAEPLEFFIELPGTAQDPAPRRYRCLAHLPPQYNPYRQYPLLLTLPGGGQPLEQNLNIWAGDHNQRLSDGLSLAVRNGHAMRNGFVVVAVDWRDPGQLDYRFSAREHRIVLDGLWESLRRFSIDSDRVFLSGHAAGAEAAYDIGVSHPEHWAGLIGYSGRFGRYIDKYMDNRHVGLPMYCVNGEKDIGAMRSMKDALNRWIKSKRYNDVTVVQYIGRPNEYFVEDIPEAFKWIRGQRRRWPDRSGFSFECRALRQGDTYFWFFEMDGIPEYNAVTPTLFTRTEKFNQVIELTGEYTELNVFRLGPANLRIDHDATLWLSPEFFNFEQELEIKGRGKFKGFVTPSNRTLLDDVLRRADPEHAYWARVDCRDGTWEAGQ